MKTEKRNLKKKKKRKISKEDGNVKSEVTGEVIENAIVFDLNEESYDNPAIVRQKHLNNVYKNLEMFRQEVKDITTEGEVSLQQFDDQKLYKIGKELRNDLNFVLAPFENTND